MRPERPPRYGLVSGSCPLLRWAVDGKDGTAGRNVTDGHGHRHARMAMSRSAGLLRRYQRNRPCRSSATRPARDRETEMDAERDERIGRAYREHRPYLVDLAFRMLVDIGAAEDAVQDAYSRLLAADVGEIEDERGWLIVVTSRLCLDRIRSA